MTEEKRYKPTQRRLREARREGKSPKSQLLTVGAAFCIGVAGLHYLGPQTWVGIRLLVEYLWTEGFFDPALGFKLSAWILLSFVIFYLMLNSMACVVMESLQSGPHFVPAFVLLKAQRLSIPDGLSRILRRISLSWLSLLKLALLVPILACFLRDKVNFLPQLFSCTLHEQIRFSNMAVSGLSYLGICLIGFSGGLDFVLKRRQFNKQLAMSREELRREQQESDCNPLLKSARRQMHQALAMQDLIDRVRRSKVIVVERA